MYNSAGGVVLASRDGKIVCENTLDARLEVAFRKKLPEVRHNCISIIIRLLEPLHKNLIKCFHLYSKLWNCFSKRCLYLNVCRSESRSLARLVQLDEWLQLWTMKGNGSIIYPFFLLSPISKTLYNVLIGLLLLSMDLGLCLLFSSHLCWFGVVML